MAFRPRMLRTSPARAAETHVPLSSLIEAGHDFTPVEAVAIALDLFDHLARHPGAENPTPASILVSAEGSVRVDAALQTQPGLAVGELLSTLLGLPQQSERVAPALVVTARSLAREPGADPLEAAARLRDAAGLAASAAARNSARKTLGAAARRSQSATSRAVTAVMREVPRAPIPLPPRSPRPYAARRSGPAFSPRPGPPAPLSQPPSSASGQRVAPPPPARVVAPVAPVTAAAPRVVAPAAIPAPAVATAVQNPTRAATGPRSRAASRVVSLGPVAAVAAGALLLVVAGGLALSKRPALGGSHAASAAAPAPAPAPSAAASPAGLAGTGGSAPPTTSRPAAPAFVPADSPDAAVTRFFSLVAQHQFDAAALYWTPRLREAVPPADLVAQYSDLRSVELKRNSVVALDSDNGIANVAVDARLDVGGQPYDLVGNLYLGTGPNGWRIDQIQVKQING